MELEALFSPTVARPAERSVPTVIVRRRRLVAAEAGTTPESEPAAPVADQPAVERPARVFVRQQSALPDEVAAPAEVTATAAELAPEVPADDSSGVEAKARRARRQRPDFMKPSEVVVIRPALAEVATEGGEPSGADLTDAASAVDAASGEEEGAAAEPALYVFDLEINARWAAVDKALADLRASLSRPQRRRRA
jgi:hypothetical protein